MNTNSTDKVQKIVEQIVESYKKDKKVLDINLIEKLKGCGIKSVNDAISNYGIRLKIRIKQ